MHNPYRAQFNQAAWDLAEFMEQDMKGKAKDQYSQSLLERIIVLLSEQCELLYHKAKAYDEAREHVRTR